MGLICVLLFCIAFFCIPFLHSGFLNCLKLRKLRILRFVFYFLSEYRKIWTRNNSAFGHVSRSGVFGSCLTYSFMSHCTKMKFSVEDFFNKYNQIRRKLQIWLHLPKKSLVENFILCVVRNLVPSTSALGSRLCSELSDFHEK